MTTRTQATIEDLYQIKGKAEIVNGEILLMADLLPEEEE